MKANSVAPRATRGMSGWAACCALVASLGSGGCAASTECADYLPVAIARMRQAQGSGCFELTHLVVLARTPSATAPRLYLQDTGGGDFSALMVQCGPSSTHPCTASTAAKVAQLIDGASVTARGYYQQGSVTGFEELYLDEVVDEGTLSAPPEPAQLQVADIARAVRSPAQWFQIVTVDIPIEDPLVMYDFSPPELALSGPCPAFGGFGMIPFSAAASSPPVPGCGGDASSVNPVGVAAPDPREILIGRQFFKDFFASSDCACAAESKQHKLSPSSALLGPVEIRGILIWQRGPGGSGAHQVFEPIAKGFPITER